MKALVLCLLWASTPALQIGVSDAAGTLSGCVAIVVTLCILERE